MRQDLAGGGDGDGGIVIYAFSAGVRWRRGRTGLGIADADDTV